MRLWCLLPSRLALAGWSLSRHGRLQLAARVVHADRHLPRRLGATDSSTATSRTWHNGTHEERVVNATWQCTYPEGKCFHNHAPLEGLPEKMEACVHEYNEDPLTVQMTIDLTCAGMTNVHCDDKMETRKFDPFYLCNNNPLLLTAECQMECKDRRPVEHCVFHFDSQGVYNMSDETVDICSLEAVCMSPYIEQNQMLCSGHQTVGKFKPHWTQGMLPDRQRADHGIRGALKQQNPKSSFTSRAFLITLHGITKAFLKALTAIALVSLFGAAVFASRRPAIMQRFIDGIFGSARRLTISRIGGSYQAPQVVEFQPMDVPPLEAVRSKRPAITPDEELDSLRGAT